MIGEIYLSSDHLASGSVLTNKYTPVCVPTRRGDPLGRPRSFMPTRSFMPATIKSQGRASPHGPGRPRSFMPPRSVHAKRSKQIASAGAPPPGRPRPTRSFMPATKCLAPTVPTRRGDPGSPSIIHANTLVHGSPSVIHSCQHARSCPRQSNREAVPRPHGPAKRSMCPNA